ncbi:glycosyl transferase [Methylobacterium sp. Leaf456]|uniref:glycosyltransferase family 2 protein n=1 Tax=Methylobacterium sp. Leaf456 TaxID=1736382 RepID=UPI0006FE9CCC|nr:glycosyltransferase family 2 protein [Methylobacterium sp. Leaf456]KQT53628.1 glycosyl transferase [Methylobacterium sp. Leaf456]
MTGAPLPDALLFAAEPAPNFFRRLVRAARHPLRLLPILAARLTGRRVRAATAFAALTGAHHRLEWPGPVPAAEPNGELARHGIERIEPAPHDSVRIAPEGSPLVLLAAPGHSLVAGAAAAIAAAFADPSLHALYGDALVRTRPGNPWLPLLRPAFDPDFLRAVDWLGPVLILRRASAAAIDPVPGALTLDMALDLHARHGLGAVRHLPRQLSRSTCPSDGGGEGARAETRRARLKAVRHDLDRAGEGDTLAFVEPDGVIRLERPLPVPRPRVSLIVPTRDRLDLLRPCIESLRARTDWPAKDILICDNGSREPATLAYLEELRTAGAARILDCAGPFDFAAINNRAAQVARGSVLAFVNNDVEAEQPDWLERMVREALRPEIGAVGARLIDGAGRIQHGGIVLGTGGLATHSHRFFSTDAPGYFSALRATRSVAAVTAACLVIEAKKFQKIGGFDPAFAVDFNDLDLCLRLNAAGSRTLFVGGAVLHHRESASRRPSPASAARHAAEIVALKKRWGPLLAQDPHYHPGLDPDLSTHVAVRRGWTGVAPAEPR